MTRQTIGRLTELSDELWSIKTESGEVPSELSADKLYEVQVVIEDGGEADISEAEREIKLSVVLAK